MKIKIKNPLKKDKMDSVKNNLSIINTLKTVYPKDAPKNFNDWCAYIHGQDRKNKFGK